MDPIPDKILQRKDEITADFLSLFERHIDDLLHSRIDRRFHAKDFGELLFIHPRHLTNTLHLTTGQSPCDFMENRIQAEAEKLLRETDLPIGDIAARFAYREPTNFTKFFRIMRGCTPLQYRKSQRKPVPR